MTMPVDFWPKFADMGRYHTKIILAAGLCVFEYLLLNVLFIYGIHYLGPELRMIAPTEYYSLNLEHDVE